MLMTRLDKVRRARSCGGGPCIPAKSWTGGAPGTRGALTGLRGHGEYTVILPPGAEPLMVNVRQTGGSPLPYRRCHRYWPALQSWPAAVSVTEDTVPLGKPGPMQSPVEPVLLRVVQFPPDPGLVMPARRDRNDHGLADAYCGQQPPEPVTPVFRRSRLAVEVALREKSAAGEHDTLDVLNLPENRPDQAGDLVDLDSQTGARPRRGLPQAVQNVSPQPPAPALDA